MLLALILVSVYAAVVTYIAVVQIKRQQKVEEIANNVVARLDSISRTIREAGDVLNDSRMSLAFANDDEVGVFFQKMKDLQAQLSDFTLESSNEEA